MKGFGIIANEKLIQAGLSEQQAKLVSDTLFHEAENRIKSAYGRIAALLTSNNSRGSGIDENVVRSRQNNQTPPTVTVEIKRNVTKIMKGGKKKMEWGVEFKINDRFYTVNFGSKERAMLYMCTLLRTKIGEKMYIHEFFNNSKGKFSRLKKQSSRVWLKAVFETIFPNREREYKEWVGKIEAKNGRPLNQGKTQANNLIKRTLEDEPKAVPSCVLNTNHDKLGDSFYHIDIKAENIIVPNELSFLVDKFYEMTGTKPMDSSIKE